MKVRPELEKELRILKEKLITAKDFREVGDYFFDNLNKQGSLFQNGKRAKHPVLRKIIQSIAEKLFGKKDVAITRFLLTKLEGYKFYHGVCFVEGKPAGLFYFEDIDVGMAFVARQYPETSFVRFSAITRDSDRPATFPTKHSEAIH